MKSKAKGKAGRAAQTKAPAVKEPPEELNTHARLNIGLDSAVAERLRAYVNRTGESIASVVEQALRAFLKPPGY